MTAYLKLEVIRTIRNPMFLAITVAMPTVLYLVFSSGSQAAAAASLVGMACYGAMFAAMSVTGGVIEDRAGGWLRQLRTTPMAPGQVVGVKLASTLLVVLPALVVVDAVGAVRGGVDMSAAKWVEAVGLLWLGSLPFCLLALAIGYIATPKTAQLWSMTSVLGFSILGGLFVSTDHFPSALATFSRLLPTNRLTELGTAAFTGQPLSGTAFAVLAAWAVAFGAFAIAAYRRAGHRS